MQHYTINITLSNGDQVSATVEAADSATAIKKVIAAPHFQRFVGSATVTHIDCRQVEPSEEQAPTYMVQPSRTEGRAVITDVTHGVTMTFAIGHLDDQHITALDDQMSATDLAHWCRLMADWLQSNRLDLISTDADALRKWRLLRVGQTIAAARKKRGLTQSQLAYISNLPSGSLAKIERGETNSSTAILGKIAAALGIELDIR